MTAVVLGIDSSTSATKVIAFDATGRLVAETRATYPMSTPAPGQFEQNAEDWWTALCNTTRGLLSAHPDLDVQAVCIGHQRETFVLVDGAGRSVRPAITWLDERARHEVEELSARLGRDRIRDISGKPPDPTPALYALAWLARHEAEALRQADAILDVQGYLNDRLTGRRVTSTASADPLGILDLATGTWSPELLAASGLAARQLPELVRPGTVVGPLTPAAAAQTGLAPATPVVAGAGDGQLTGLGLGALGGRDAYLSLGTGIVSGMYSPDLVTADAFRTLTSPTGQGFVMETVLRSGMVLADWTAQLTGRAIGALADEAGRLPPGADGLMVLPHFAGVMNPYWDGAARGAMVGLSLTHGPAHVFRAMIEGLAFEQAVATAALESETGKPADRFIACGGGVRSDMLLSVLAAVLGRPVAVSPVSEGVALGAAMLAAAGVGLYPDADAASRAMAARPERIVEPVPALADAYAPRLAVYADLFAALRGVQHRLGKVAQA